MKKLLYIGNRLSVHGSTPTGIEILGPLLEQEGMHVTYASSKKNKFARLSAMLWQTLVRNKTLDFVLIDTYSTSNFWYAFTVSQLCRLLNIKYIPILHGGGLPRRIAKNPKLCKMVFMNAFINVAPSGYLLEKFHAAGYSRVRYVQNPVEFDFFPFKQRQEIKPRLLWVRSLSPIYNPQMALKALHLLKAIHPDATLCMVGPDKRNMRPALFQMADELGIAVKFMGRMTKSEWAALSNDYDIFINTARIDNAPYSLIEAAALGLPIVSTNIGGIPYLFTDKKTALLVDNNDAKGMANAVREIIDNQALRTKIVDSALQLSHEFEWANVKNKWLDILTQA